MLPASSRHGLHGRLIGAQDTTLVSYIYADVRSAEAKVVLIPYIFQAGNTFRLLSDKPRLQPSHPFGGRVRH